MFQNQKNSWIHIPLTICALVVSVFISVSCSDDESFTTDPTALLSFESDTIKFDTIFSTVPSTTKRIRLFNRSSKGLHIQSVRLASGGSSGFRFNVDGYSGPVVDKIEIGGNDSLFLFTDVTLPLQDTDSPTLVRDTLLFRLESGVEQRLLLEATTLNADFMDAQVISGNLTLEGPRPVIVRDSLIVGENATLTVKAGTVLCFHSGAWLGVKGKLRVEGTAEAPVVFRGDRTDRMFSYLPYDRLDGQWGGIILQKGCQSCEIDHADIHGGSWGIIADDFGSDSEILTLTNSSIHNVRACALELTDSRATVANTQLSNAGGDCVRLTGGNYSFTYCTLAQFYPWGSCGYALSLSAGTDDDYKPLESAAFINCVITGRVSDQISLSPPKNVDIALNASFAGSLVNIDLPSDTPERYRVMFEGAANEYEQFEKDAASDVKDEKRSFGRGNFKVVDDDLYDYDFHLDTLSNARGVADAEAGSRYPTDRDGHQRPETKPDAGCYQFIE